MWRTAGLILLLAIAAYVLINVLVTTEPERVEAELERLLDVARKGGAGAADEILAALADDYRGSGSFSRERIEGYLRRHLPETGVPDLTTGDYVALWKGEEMLVPILSMRARTERQEYSFVLRVTFADRDGHWRIVNVEQWRLER